MRAAPLVLVLLTAACGGEAGPETGPEPATPGDGYRGDERPAPEAPEIPAGAPSVAFVGDSIAAGLHLEASAAFPAVLQRRLAAEGLPFRLVNAGVSGDTSAGGLARIDWILKQRPDLVVIELGGNDGLRGIDLGTTEENLRALLVRAKESGARLLLLGVRVPTSLGAEYSAGFAAMYPRLAEQLELPLVPFFMEGVGGVPELNLPDGLHPTAAGHERLADNVVPALRAALEALPGN